MKKLFSETKGLSVFDSIHDSIYLYRLEAQQPLCRVTPIENLASIPQYDREKCKEMILDAAETVLGMFGLNERFEIPVFANGKYYLTKLVFYA
jgi:hypothetical protein